MNNNIICSYFRLEEQLEKEKEEPREQLDLAFKEGQTIKVNINIPRKSGRERSKSPCGSGGIPPPSRKEMAEAVAAAGIKVEKNPRIAAPPPPTQPTKSNPAWIQF